MSMTENGTEIAKRQRLTNDELRALTPDNLNEFFAAKGLVVTDLSEVAGSGFAILPTKEKGRLVGVEFMILEWHFSEGDNGEFASLTVITRQGEKLIVNDGSTGIRKQLHDLDAREIAPPVWVKGGLRSSEFWYDPATVNNPDGPVKSRTQLPGYSRGETFYLAV